MSFCQRCNKDVHPIQELGMGARDAEGRVFTAAAVFSACPECRSPLRSDDDEPTGDEFAVVVKTASVSVASQPIKQTVPVVTGNVVEMVRARRDALLKRVAELRLLENELLQLESMLDAAERVAPRLDADAPEAN